jgi:hypothetical protein
MLNKQIKNQIYTKKRILGNQPPNMLYAKHNSLFDVAMSSDEQKYFIPLDINTNKPFIDNIFYSCVWINSALEFAQNKKSLSEYFVPHIISIHDAPPQTMKKEDMQILFSNTSAHKILSFFSNDSVWEMPNIEYINYGVIPPKNIDTVERNKNILIINTKKQKQIEAVYQHLKQTIPGTDTLYEFSNDINENYAILSKYRICIDTDTYYNLLAASACGCYCVTTRFAFDANIFVVKDLQDMIHTVSNLLKSDIDQKTQSIASDTIKKYDWSEFCTKIYNHYLNSI